MITYRVSLSRLGLALAAVLLLLGGPTPSEAAPTQSQCADAWSRSSADDSCDHETIIVESDKCRITVSCQTEDAWFSLADTIATSLASVDDLHNCNGRLQVGGCE